MFADLLHTPMTQEEFRAAIRARRRATVSRRLAEAAEQRPPAYWSCCGQWDETIRDRGHLIGCWASGSQ